MLNHSDGVFTPCPVPSPPTYEPNSIDGEYSHLFRHIQYKRIASLRPIATLAMLRCRRIARWMSDVSTHRWHVQRLERLPPARSATENCLAY